MKNIQYMLLGTSAFLLAVSCNTEDPVVFEKFTFELSDTTYNRSEFTVVKLEKIREDLTFFGKVVPDENKLVEVFPLVGGNVSEVNVELGDFVKKGQILAVIKSSEIAEYESALINAKSELMLAEKNLNIAQDLFADKLVPERDVLIAKKDLEKAQGEQARLQAIFDIYGINSRSEYYVKAPISGFVVEKKINRDMQLRSDKSDNIFTIAQLNEVWVMVNVGESLIDKIKEGVEAEVKTISYGDQIFKGKTDKIFNVLDPQTKAMKVRVRLNNEHLKLKPEMNASVKLKFEEEISLPAVPSDAIIFDKNKNFVLVYKSKTDIQIREVEILKQGPEMSYLKAGIQVGETIITKNQLFIYDALTDLQ